MTISAFLARAAFLIACCSALYGQREGATPSVAHDPQKLLSLVKRIEPAPGRFNKALPTVIFTTSTTQCTGCCASAINLVLNDMRRNNVNVNAVVVVMSARPDQAGWLHSIFETGNIFIEESDATAIALAADEYVPSLFVISPDGKLMAEVRDIQHQSDILDRLLSLKLPSKTPKPVSFDSDRQIKNFDGFSGGGVPVASLASARNELVMFDAASVSVRGIGISDGKEKWDVKIADSLAFYFRTPEDDPSLWSLLQRNYRPLIRLSGLEALSASSPSFRAVATFFTGYRRNPPGQMPEFVFEKGICAVDFHAGAFGPVWKFDDRGRYFARSPIVFLGDKGFLASCGVNALSDTGTDNIPKDSLYLFAWLKPGHRDIRPCLKIAEIESLYGTAYNPQYVSLQCASRDGRTGFYLDEGNRIFLRLTIGDSSITARKFQPRGMLQALLSDSSSLEEGVFAADIATNGLIVNVLLVDGRGRDDVLVLQTYGADGQFLSEHPLKAKPDALAGATLVGYANDWLVMISQWRKNGFRVGTIKTDKIERALP